MDFDLTEEQEMLRKFGRDFIVDKCPKKYVREMESDEKGYSPDVWRGMAEMGWMGLAFPEEYGGGMKFLIEVLSLDGRSPKMASPIINDIKSVDGYDPPLGEKSIECDQIRI